MAPINPLSVIIQEPPDNEVLTASQWTTLLALAETVVPAIQRGDPADSKSSILLPNSEYEALVTELQQGSEKPIERSVVESYLAESPASYKAYRQELQRSFALYTPQDTITALRGFFDSLNSSASSWMLTGYTTPFHEQPLPIRTQILRGWAQSYIPSIRAVASSLPGLLKNTWSRTSPSLGPVLRFPRAPEHGKPGQGYDFQFMQFADSETAEVLETDVVIVGSGCGGGVVAKNLTADGHDVIVVDKAYYHSPEYLPMSEKDAAVELFEGGGVQPTDDKSVTIIAGSAWGGGGTINWSASLQPQAHVRQEWANEGLDFFTGAEFQKSLDRVCHRMGVSDKHIEPNHGNRALLEGARKLGYTHKAVPQNTGGNKHYCGYCTLGCGAAEKQGPVVSWLPDAARDGAKFIQGFQAEKVLFDERNGQKKAVGVVGKWTSKDREHTRQVIVRAKRVVLSAGSLWTPVLLKQSGLTSPQIGKGLKLHIASWVMGIWPEEIRPWEGGILTGVSDQYQDLDGRGHGVKLENMVMMPSWMLPLSPKTGMDFKKFATKFKNMSAFITLCREEGSGRVYPDPVSGRPRMAYTPSATDRKHTIIGIEALAKICYVTGATEIHTTVKGLEPFIRAEHSTTSDADEDLGINDPAFQQWLKKVRAADYKPTESPFGSAHQMGSCRMGVNPKTSAVNPRGQVWDTQNLYVADASVFPSASGVNPMVTNMGISDYTSRKLSAALKKEKTS